jgi:hypothetical protein
MNEFVRKHLDGDPKRAKHYGRKDIFKTLSNMSSNKSLVRDLARKYKHEFTDAALVRAGSEPRATATSDKVTRGTELQSLASRRFEVLDRHRDDLESASFWDLAVASVHELRGTDKAEAFEENATLRVLRLTEGVVDHYPIALLENGGAKTSSSSSAGDTPKAEKKRDARRSALWDCASCAKLGKPCGGDRVPVKAKTMCAACGIVLCTELREYYGNRSEWMLHHMGVTPPPHDEFDMDAFIAKFGRAAPIIAKEKMASNSSKKSRASATARVARASFEGAAAVSAQTLVFPTPTGRRATSSSAASS